MVIFILRAITDGLVELCEAVGNQKEGRASFPGLRCALRICAFDFCARSVPSTAFVTLSYMPQESRNSHGLTLCPRICKQSRAMS